ncbi:hypothetical protein QVD17_15642 [Tagetes erecta]|uniref:Uncharacterized protein n=1 Tax=Tagetes erecta TaxID=13708 RepID=A0AAD8NST7_TARER|nr:hypothetical protein QVD17_15642 [Tagetes erecta]
MNPVTYLPPPALPELRRSKSLSAAKNKELGLGFFTGVLHSPNTPSSLFSTDDENILRHQTTASSGDALETNEQEEDNVFNHEHDEIRVSEEDEEMQNLNDLENEIVEMEAKIDSIVDNLKSINQQIDLDVNSKKPSLSNFWRKKLQNLRKWRRKRVNGNGVVSTLSPEKRGSRRHRETQSEIGEYGFGRGSCDLGPRFSLDAGRVSFEDPRGSWDGYVIGRSFPKLPPIVGDVKVSGGCVKTSEYYLNAFSKRMKGVDRSNSVPTMAGSVVDDVRLSNSKVSPGCIGYDHRLKFRSIGGEQELEMGGDDKEVKKQRWWNRKLWRFVNRTKKG